MDLIELGISDYRYAPILSEIPYYIKFRQPTLFTGSPNKRCLAIVSDTTYDTYQERGHGLPMVRLVTQNTGVAGGIADPDDIFFNFVHKDELDKSEIQTSIITALRNIGLAVYTIQDIGIPIISISGVGDCVIGTSPLTNGPYDEWYVTYWYIRLSIDNYDYSSAYKANALPCLDSFAGSSRKVAGILDFYPMLSKKKMTKHIADQLALTFNYGEVSYRNKKDINFTNIAKRNYPSFLNDSWLYDNIHP